MALDPIAPNAYHSPDNYLQCSKSYRWVKLAVTRDLNGVHRSTTTRAILLREYYCPRQPVRAELRNERPWYILCFLLFLISAFEYVLTSWRFKVPMRQIYFFTYFETSCVVIEKWQETWEKKLVFRGISSLLRNWQRKALSGLWKCSTRRKFHLNTKLTWKKLCPFTIGNLHPALHSKIVPEPIVRMSNTA